MSVRLGIALFLVLIVGSGCATGIRGGKKYTRFAPNAAALVEPARHSGDHFIVVRMAHEEGLARWPDTKRTLRAGDPVGFKRDDRGHLLAVAGDATRSLEPLPVGVAYLAWYHRPQRPLHDVAHKLRDGAAVIAGTAATAAVVGGAIVANAAIEDALDGDDDEQPDWLKRQRGRERRREPTTARSAPGRP